MTYLSRALHFFIKIVVVISLVFAVMYFMGWLDVEEGQFWNTMFDTPKGWIVISAIVLISAIYPVLSFSTVSVRGDFDNERKIMDHVLTQIGYKQVYEDNDRSEYRVASLWKKLFNQFDDRITVSRNGSYITVSGLKKEVMRIESLFTQYRLNNE